MSSMWERRGSVIADEYLGGYYWGLPVKVKWGMLDLR